MNGLIAAPISLRIVVLAFKMYAIGPKGFTASVQIAPPYDGSGVFSAGCLSGTASQSKLPLSTIIPPIDVP